VKCFIILQIQSKKAYTQFDFILKVKVAMVNNVRHSILFNTVLALLE